MTVSSSPAGRIAVVGSINVDQVVRVDRHPLPGETLLGRDLRMLPGGKGANQAVAASRMGSAVTMVGAVGTDEAAQLATTLLRKAGVDVEAVATVEGPTGLAIISVDDKGENTIVVLPGANASVDAAAVRAEGNRIAEAAVVVVQCEIPADAIAEAMRTARGRVVLNLAPVVDLDAEIIRAANPLVVNEHEGALVLSQLDPESAAAADDEELVNRLRSQGIQSVVLTRGALGAIGVDNDGLFQSSAPRVPVVDTTGAGDAFVGALSARLAAGDSLRESVALAVRAGAFAVQARGAQTSYASDSDELPGASQ